MGNPGSIPPIVAPGPALSPEESARWARHLTLPGVGAEGQRRLRAARVLSIGAGGLGSPVVLYLAAAGIGRLGILDFDVVEASNLQRQIAHGDADIGRGKTASAAEAVAALTPYTEVVRHDVRLTAENAVGILSGYDIVVDGTDNFATRFLVADAAEIVGVPVVWGSINRFEGQVAVFWSGPGAPSDGVTLRDLYPEPPEPGTVPTCAEAGVFGAVVGTVGSLMATEVLKLCAGVGRPLLGRVAVYDGWDLTLRTLRVRRDPGREPATDLRRHRGGDDRGGGVDVPGIDAEELASLLTGARPPVLVDVREPHEWAISDIEGAVHVPLAELLASGPGDLPEGVPVVVYCRVGQRSATAVGALLAAGYRDVVNLRGGINAWAARVAPHLPVY